MAEQTGPAVGRKDVPIVDDQVLTLPRGATILNLSPAWSTGAVDGAPLIEVWYLADPRQADEQRRLRMVDTGQLATVTATQYVGSVIHHAAAGRAVRHVFDLGVTVDVVTKLVK